MATNFSMMMSLPKVLGKMVKFDTNPRDHRVTDSENAYVLYKEISAAIGIFLLTLPSCLLLLLYTLNLLLCQYPYCWMPRIKK